MVLVSDVNFSRKRNYSTMFEQLYQIKYTNLKIKHSMILRRSHPKYELYMSPKNCLSILLPTLCRLLKLYYDKENNSIALIIMFVLLLQLYGINWTY